MEAENAKKIQQMQLQQQMQLVQRLKMLQSQQLGLDILKKKGITPKVESAEDDFDS